MIIFADTNQELCELVKELIPNLTVLNENVFKVKERYPQAKIVTASNPSFNAGGGLDLALSKAYPNEWRLARNGYLTNNLLFVVSVNSDFRAYQGLIKLALMVVKRESVSHDLILTGLGTGIGGLSQKVFVNLLKRVMKK